MLSRARSGAIDPGSELRRSVPSPNATVQPVSLTSSGGASIASGGQASKRTNTAREVLQTERYYMECLQVMLEHYMQPLNAACQDRKQNPGFNENDIRSIFSNHLTLIVGVNNELLRGLESKLATWDDSNSKIADVFLMMAPFLKMYYEYSANYNAAIDTYNRLMKDPLFGARLLVCWPALQITTVHTYLPLLSRIFFTAISTKLRQDTWIRALANNASSTSTQIRTSAWCL
jgi:hypothetical protein